ncbi:GNAT family N-acetyltransferase [Jatrophihabitans fulvus]
MLQSGWMGRRVTVRRVVERTPEGRLLFGDVVGDLVGLDAQTAVVETRDGLVEVPVALVAVAKLAPPSTADELALDRVAARGLRSADTRELDGWTLRADHGFLRRANSVLTAGQLRRPLGDALDEARAWYAERGLPLRLAVPAEARRLLDAELGERGWEIEVEAQVLTARLDMVAAPPADVVVQRASDPDDAWLARYDRNFPPTGRDLLARHDRVVFVSVRNADRAVAIGRGVVDDGWLGVAAVEVEPEQRRRGLAAAIMRELWQWGREHGATRSYLQVDATNDAAAALYAKLGYAHHHDYRYRREPGS